MKPPFDLIDLDQCAEEALIDRIDNQRCDDADFALFIQIIRFYT